MAFKFSKKNLFSLAGCGVCTVASVVAYADSQNIDVVLENKLVEQTPIQPVDLEEQKNTRLPELVKDAQQSVKGVQKEAIGSKERLEYLKKNPEVMESVLLTLIRNIDAQKLAEILPVYKNYQKHDPSVIDWGNAIIAASQGKFGEAIRLFRKLNAALPDVKLLRLQMAITLFMDRQYISAKNELEKLRSEEMPEQYTNMINNYINIINKKDDFNFNVSLGYVNDKNITNAPPIGTKLGDSWTYTSKHQAGKGVSYGLSASKEWLSNSKFFKALHFSSGGKYYFDNKKYSDLSAKLGVGFGYKNPIAEVELEPNISQRWTGGWGSTKSDTLKNYSRSLGLRLGVNYWLTNNWRYQNHTQFSKTNYVKRDRENNSTDVTYSNTLMYLPSQITYFYGGIDFTEKNAESKGLGYFRKSARLGWGQSWPLGISSRVMLEAGNRKYKGTDFFGIIRDNNEYNAGVSLWHRAVYFYGLTPRINYNYSMVTSNESFQEYKKHTVSAELSATF